MKKLFRLCFLLAVLALFVVAASCESTGTCGDNLTWTLDDVGMLTISGTGAMTDYSYPSYAPWYGDRDSVKKVVIESGVTSIGEYAFNNCSSLASITIPDSVTSVGYSAFEDCNDLTSITIPSSVTSIGDWAFYNCSSLTSITIPSSVTTIGEYAFSGCSSLTDITIPDSFTTIGEYAFYNCSGLTNITIPSSVTSIGSYAFSGCSGLTNITIPDSVTSIRNGAFSGCSGLTDITIPDSVTSIGNSAFSGCSGLTDITIPDSVTTIGEYAFYNCSGLTNITIPSSVTSVGYSAFEYCSGLTNITIPDSITSIGSYAFSDCSGLTNITIPDSVTSIRNGAFSGCSGLTDITIPDSVTSIGNSAFSCCSGLTDITIPDSVTTIGEYAFSGCSGLTNITIPSSVTSIGSYAFSGCSGLTDITIPDSVTTIGEYAFYNCSGLTNITIPDSVTSIRNGAFSGCSSLTDITIPDSVTSIGEWAFYNCSSLTSITIPDSVTSIRNGAFSGCSSLTRITIPDKVTSIGWSAFYRCSRLTSITIPEGVTSIGEYAFNDCSSLTSITIPSSVTSIGDSAFRYCSSLTSIAIPEGVTSIGNYIFYNCSSLTSITIPDSVTSIGNTIFYHCSSNLIVYCNEDSAIQRYCIANDYNWVILHEHCYALFEDHPATCTDSGYQVLCCTICEATKEEIVQPALGHTESDWILISVPSCTQPGSRMRKCEVCQEELLVERLDAYGHTEGDWEITPGSCTKGGNKTKTCLVCGKVTQKEALAANGHEWGEWSVVSTASVMSEGRTSRVCGICGETENVTTPKIEVDYTADTNYAMAHFHVVSASDREPICGASIRITTSGGETALFHSDENGRLSQILPVGETRLSVFSDGYNVRNITINLHSGENTVPTIGISKNDLVDCQLHVTEMAYEEMVDVGIDIGSTSNQQVFKYELKLQFSPGVDWESIFFYIDPHINMPVPYIPSNKESEGKLIVYDGCTVGTQFTFEEDIVSVYPISENYFLVIHGNVRWLKEMYDVELIAINNSMTDVLSNTTAELCLPEGMSLAAMKDCKQSLLQYIGEVSGGEKKSVHWYVCGDEEGEYHISASLRGVLLPFGEPVDYTFTTPNPIKVYAGQAMKLTYYIPDSAFEGEEYTVRIELENVSSKTLYGVSHSVADIEQYEITYYEDLPQSTKSYPTQPGGYIYVEEFHPGDKLIMEIPARVLFDSSRLKDNLHSLSNGVLNLVESYKMLQAGLEIVPKLNKVFSTVKNSIEELLLSSEEELTAVHARGLEKTVGALEGLIKKTTNASDSSSLKLMNMLRDCALAKETKLWSTLESISQSPAVLGTMTSIEIWDIVARLSASADAPMPTEKFGAREAIAQAIELIPIRYFLEDASITVLDGSNVEISTDIIIEHIGPHYFGVDNVGKYLYDLMMVSMGDFISTEPFLKTLGLDAKQAMGIEQSTESLKTANGKALEFLATDRKGNGTFRAWYESSADSADYSLTSSNSTAYMEGGVLCFKGTGFVHFTPLSDTSGCLYIQAPDGNITSYQIESVMQHTCASDDWHYLTDPHEGTKTVRVKYCDVCDQLITIDTFTPCTEHIFGLPQTVLDPTEDACGIQMKKCIVCDVENYEYTDSLQTDFCGDELTWILNPNGVLIVSGVGDMKDYEYGSAPWYGKQSAIETVIIESGVTRIGSYAFSDCTSLRCIEFLGNAPSFGMDSFYNVTAAAYYPADDISWTEAELQNYGGDLTWSTLLTANRAEQFCYWIDGDQAIIAGLMDNCKDAAAAVIPGDIEGYPVIGIASEAFHNCRNLRSVIIPGGVTSIADLAFWDCSSLTSVTIPSSITSIGASAFNGCSSLTSIMIPSGVNSISNDAFSDCSSLMSITIPSSVTSIGSGAFYGCSSLASITIPSSVADIGSGAFYGCSSLTSVPIPEGVTEIGNGTFNKCSSLVSITIPSSVIRIGSYAFCDCSNLTSVTIPASVTSIGEWAFYNCSGLKAVYITDLAAWCRIDFGNGLANPTLYANNLYLNNKKLTSVAIPNGITEIKDYTFANCSGLTSVTVPSWVTSIGFASFKDCNSLTSITIPNSITSIGGFAFWDCSSLTSITIPSGITSIEYATFGYCSGLTSITVPKSVVRIEDYAFEGCTGLLGGKNLLIINNILALADLNAANVEIPSGVTHIVGGVFELSDSLSSVTIPDTVRSISDYVFADCSKLTTITIPASVTSIGKEVLARCSSLTDVYFKGDAPQMGEGVFAETSARIHYPAGTNTWTSTVIENCGGNLTWVAGDENAIPTTWNLTLPSGLTSIGEEAFLNDTSLTTVRLSDNCTAISANAFSGCTELQYVCIPNGSCTIATNAFGGNTSVVIVTVPGSTAAKKAASMGLAVADINS